MSEINLQSGPSASRRKRLTSRAKTLAAVRGISSAVVDEWVGRTVGKFELTEVLGYEGHTVTFRGVRADIGQQVAVKVLHPPDDRRDKFIQRFESEIQALSKLQHPNIVAVFDAGKLTEGQLYYAMEFVAGRSLEQLLPEQGPMDPARCVRTVRQLAAAVGAAHTAGVFHRKLMPRHLLLSHRHGQADFVTVTGFATPQAGSLAATTTQGLSAGPPNAAYLPPERSKQIEGMPTREVLAAADVYAIGCLAFEMLVGRPPLTDQNLILQLERRRRHAPDWPEAPAVPPGLRAAVDALLHPVPGIRPSSGVEVLDHWSRLDARDLRHTKTSMAVRRRALTTKAVTTAPHKPSQPVLKAAPTKRRPVLGRGMLQTDDGSGAPLKVHDASSESLEISAFLGPGAVEPGDSVSMSFPGSGGSVLVFGTLDSVSLTGRQTHLQVRVEVISQPAVEGLLERWKPGSR